MQEDVSADEFTQGLSVMTDSVLLILYNLHGEDAARTRGALGLIEQEIRRRMEARGSKGIPDENFLCELQESFSYDPSRLQELKTLLQPQDLATCLTPEAERVVLDHEKWNGNRLRVIATRYGGRVAEIIESARFLTRSVVEFEKRVERPKRG